MDGSSAWNIQPVYNAIVENFDRALTDITWARVPARNCLEGAVCFANMTHALYKRCYKSKSNTFPMTVRERLLAKRSYPWAERVK